MLWAAAGRLRGRGHGRLGRSLLARLIALPAIALTVTLVPMGKTSVIVTSVLACTLGVTRVWLWYASGRETRREHRRRARRERTRAQLTERGLEMAAEHDPPAMAKASAIETLTANLIAALLVVFAGLCIATDVDATIQSQWQATPAHHATVTPKPSTKKPKRRQAPKHEQTPHSPSGEAGQQNPREEGKPAAKPCGAITNAPGVDANSLVRLEALLRLAGSNKETGCATSANAQDTPAGAIYSAVAHASTGGTAIAIAVIAPQQRRFVAVAPVVEAIQEKLRHGEAIGAEREFARVYAGHGFVYVILSERGSTLLSKQTLGSETPLVECPPAVATAIRSTDKQLGKWLWPSAPVSEHGEQIYKLKTSMRARARETVHYDPATRTAWRGPRSKPIPYTARQENLAIGELQTWIPEAPQEELTLEAELERDEAAGE